MGSGESVVINWRILKDSEFLTEDDFPLDFPDMVHYHAPFQDGDVSELDEPTNFFFKYVFPDKMVRSTCLFVAIKALHTFLHKCVSFLLFPCVGHAKLIDKFLSDPRATYHDTVVKDNTIFYDPDAAGLDWMVRQCYLLMIASATEIVNGVENLWKSGPSVSHHAYPDFGQYMPINYFKAFCSAAPYCWSEEQYWYEDTHDVPWDVFLPCLTNLNSK